MSTREIAYRIDIAAKDHDGSWSMLVWRHTIGGENGPPVEHESPCLWTTALGEARRAWQELDAGQVPRDLLARLDGWAGLVISAVQVHQRYRRPEGWGPWSRHSEALEGTREILTGVCAPTGTDPRLKEATDAPASPDLVPTV